MSSGESIRRTETPAHSEPILRRRAEAPPHLQQALRLLLQADDYARELGQDAWDMAVELDALREAKLTNSDLRWLDAKSYIEHAVETTGPEDCARRFRRTPLLTFTEPVCVILTRGGIAMAREVCSGDLVVESGGPRVGICQIGAIDDVPGRPKWDHQRRQLRLGAQVVKEFKLPSPNQETVLMAFEEEGWPPRVDDPLPPVATLEPRRRLHDTIKALNRKQKQHLIRFRGDGSGEGIRWEPAVPRENSSPAVLASG